MILERLTYRYSIKGENGIFSEIGYGFGGINISLPKDRIISGIKDYIESLREIVRPFYEGHEENKVGLITPTEISFGYNYGNLSPNARLKYRLILDEGKKPKYAILNLYTEDFNSDTTVLNLYNKIISMEGMEFSEAAEREMAIIEQIIKNKGGTDLTRLLQ